MRIEIRAKRIKNDRSSLYLDFYPAITHPVTGKPTRREFLNLYLINKPKTEQEKNQNKEMMAIAKVAQSERIIAFERGNYDLLRRRTPNTNLLSYFKELAEIHKRRPQGDRNHWMGVYNYVYKFTNGNCMAKSLDEDFCLRFKKYVQEHQTFVRLKEKLANNSAVLYFNIFKRMVKMAYDAGLIEKDAAKDITSIRKVPTKREYLTLEEVQSLAKAHCDLPTVKNAALFSSLTGLRYSDIAKLTWQEVYTDDDGGHSIRFIQKKTQGVQSVPISQDAFKLMGEWRNATDLVFEDMLYSAWQNQKIQEWVHRAGIPRKITFHSFRHSYATIQLSLGTNIVTIKELLGHRSIQTTMIYAKVVDSSKREAANKMRL